MKKNPLIALVHDWLISPIGGAENTLKEMYALFPAPIYTLLWKQAAFRNSPFSSAKIHPSWLQKIPQIFTFFRFYLPFFPFAIESFNLAAYDVILSSSHCVAKGIRKQPTQLHICYCHTPMRYAWDLSPDYLRAAHLDSGVKGWLAKRCLNYLREWDKRSSSQVDHFIANSNFVAQRIQKNYQRAATVIYPPVDTAYYTPKGPKENYYVTASRLVSYKKIDLIVEAFSQLPNLKLVVIGDGPELKKMSKKSTANVKFLGSVSLEVLKNHLQKAKAFIFAAIEDFGILPVEAMACGTPVIALNRGGTAETVLDRITGLLFEEQSAKHIQQAVETFETMAHPFDPVAIAAHAAQFSATRFRAELSQFVDEKIKETFL